MTDGSNRYTSRRQLLHSLGVAGGVALAGCANQDDTQSATQSTDQQTTTSNGGQSETASTPSLDFQGSWPVVYGTHRFTNSIEASTHPEPPFTELWGRNSNTITPALMDSERIYIERDGVTRALNPATGEKVWSQDNFAPTGVAGDYLVSQSPRFGVLEAKSGDRVRGPIGSGKYLGFSKRAWSPDWVYGYDNPGNGSTDVVRLHDLVSGDKRWEATIPEKVSRTAILPLRGYAESSGTVFAQAYSPDGDGVLEDTPILLGIDVEAGEVRWTSEPPIQEGENVLGIVGDAVLLLSRSDNDNALTRAISHQTGDELWRLSKDMYTYTIIGNVAVKDSDNTFTGYELESGKQLWEVSPAVGSSPRSFGRGGRLYVAGGNREDGEFVTKVYNMDGELLWEKTGIITYRATGQALFGTIGDFDNYQMGMLVEE